MTDPPRLFHSDADDFERALLGAAQRDRGSAAAKARCIAAASSTALVATSASVASASLVVSAVKAAGVGVLLGVALTGASAMVNAEPRPSAKALSSIAKPVVAASRATRAPLRVEVPPLKAETQPVSTSAAALPSLAEVRRAPVRPSSGARARTFAHVPVAASPSIPRVAPAAQTADGSLAREVQALDEARLALAARDATRALEMLERYERAFPRGALVSESLVLRVQALNSNGQSREAEALARSFLAAHPDDAQARKLAELFDRRD